MARVASYRWTLSIHYSYRTQSASRGWRGLSFRNRNCSSLGNVSHPCYITSHGQRSPRQELGHAFLSSAPTLPNTFQKTEPAEYESSQVRIRRVDNLGKTRSAVRRA